MGGGLARCNPPFQYECIVHCIINVKWLFSPHTLVTRKTEVSMLMTMWNVSLVFSRGEHWTLDTGRMILLVSVLTLL